MECTVGSLRGPITHNALLKILMQECETLTGKELLFMLKSYGRQIVISASPLLLYRALTVRIGEWWVTPQDSASVVPDTPLFSFSPSCWKMRVRKLVTGKRVVWACVDAHHVAATHSPAVQGEWLGTTLSWDITIAPQGTCARFMHDGLIPGLERHDVCVKRWDHLFKGSLRSVLER